jgi:hypothetical protein
LFSRGTTCGLTRAEITEVITGTVEAIATDPRSSTAIPAPSDQWQDLIRWADEAGHDL